MYTHKALQSSNIPLLFVLKRLPDRNGNNRYYMFLAKILLVDDSKSEAAYFRDLLINENYNIIIAEDGAKALDYLNSNSSELPDIVITDLIMPQIDGYELIRIIREKFPDIFIIVITGMDGTSLADSFKVGARDYVNKSFRKDELLVRVKNAVNLKKAEQQLKKTVEMLNVSNKKLEELSIIDDLTGIYNRRYFFQQLKMMIHQFHRYSTPFCLAIIDIDFFKDINDKYGHPSGDEVLKKLASISKHTIRKFDIVARLGGDEFALIIQNAEIDKALIVMDHLQANIKNLTFDFASDKRLELSGGICAYKAEYSLEHFIAEADKLLYKAKENGKNRIESCINVILT